MSAALFPAIYDVIQKNPTKHATIALCRDETTTTAQGFETWDRFTLKPIQPPGPLSLMAWHSDPMYSLGTPALRKQILTETLLQLHDRVDKELVGRRWPRKKIQDMLATQVSVGAPSATPLIESVLCELYQLQKISLSRKSKSISFYPEDVRNWSSDRAIIVGDDEGCWYYEPVEAFSLVEWIQEKEEQGWKIQWPTADGKLEDLKAALQQKGLTARTAPGSDATKVKKEDYARILGRAESLSILRSLQLRVQ